MITAVEIFSLNSAMVVAVGIEERVSLLTSGDGDNMTRLISTFSMIVLVYGTPNENNLCARVFAWSEFLYSVAPLKILEVARSIRSG